MIAISVSWAHLATAVNTELAHWPTAFSGEASILSPSHKRCCGSVCALQLTSSHHRSWCCFIWRPNMYLKRLMSSCAALFSTDCQGLI